MSYAIVLWVLLFGAAVIMGFVTGKKSEQGKPLLLFLTGMGMTLVFGWVILFLLRLSFDSGCELQRRFRPAPLPDSVIFLSDMINPGLNTAAGLWVTAWVLTLSALVLFVIAFNCRRTAGNIYISCGGVLFFIMVVFFCLPWASHGLNAFSLLGRAYTEYPFYALEAGWSVAGLSLLMLIVWTVYVFRGRRKGWNVLLAQGGIALGIYAGCWLSALAVVYPYGCYIRAKLEKMGIQSYSVTNVLPAAVSSDFAEIEKFRAAHRNMALPFNDVYSWTKDKARVPPDKREYTLKIFDTPEFEAFLAAYERLLRNGKDVSNMNLPLLNHTRSYARIRAGRAALFLETGQEEKILPELMKITMIDAEILNDSPALIEELVRIAVRNIWYSGMVRLGPDGPEYAPVYREALDRMKAQGVRVTTELRCLLHMLDSSLRFKGWQDAWRQIKGNYSTFLMIPAMIAQSARAASIAIKLEKMCEKLEQTQVFEVPLHDGAMERMLRLAAIRGRLLKAIMTTGLALKLYRSEKGVYPEKLGQLVPEYLDAVPLCPYTGEPLVYTSDGKAFRLTVAEESKTESYYLDTERNY